MAAWVERVPQATAVTSVTIVGRMNLIARERRVLSPDRQHRNGLTLERKLLEKQKEGRKRMKPIGRANIPREACIEVLKSN